MASKVEFGITLPQRGALFGVTTMRDMLDMTCEAENSGMFSSAWVGDSLFAKPRPESLTLLGALAGVTNKLTLGVGCMATFPVRDPIIFAYQWANLDLISEGRMLLAACNGLVAGGASAKEGSYWGVTDKERSSRLEENIEICRRLWSEDDVSFSGKFQSFEGVSVQPKPVQDPCPIWIASNPRPGTKFVDRSMRRVVDLADGWMTVRMIPGSMSGNWGKICEFLKEDGRNPDEFPNMAYQNININPDKQAALEESKKFLDAYYGPVFSPEMVAGWTATGTPEQCIEDLRGIIAEGAKTITLRITSWDQKEQYKRMVNEVLPYVNE